MKKLLFLILVMLPIGELSAQILLPKKETKGIRVKQDDFLGSVIYTSKATGITVESFKDKCNLKLVWTYETPEENYLD